mmetsp:Transcript_121968/g.389992  ORF Transcript_121968/g.389992 Transcript_121968/m.389992 type:complete len:201 (+) Transcript_121968:488-1090(+)
MELRKRSQARARLLPIRGRAGRLPGWAHLEVPLQGPAADRGPPRRPRRSALGRRCTDAADVAGRSVSRRGGGRCRRPGLRLAGGLADVWARRHQPGRRRVAGLFRPSGLPRRRRRPRHERRHRWGRCRRRQRQRGEQHPYVAGTALGGVAAWQHEAPACACRCCFALSCSEGLSGGSASAAWCTGEREDDGEGTCLWCPC